MIKQAPDHPEATPADPEGGATTLEWALLLAVIALPSYYIIRMLLELLLDHYRMMTMVNSLPLP